MKGYRDVTWMHNQRPFELFDESVTPICVEIAKGSVALPNFVHPPNAVYVFGPEDGGVPQVIRRHCYRFIDIPAFHCLNLAGAVNIVLHHRLTHGTESWPRVGETESRGEILQPGWEGR